MDGQYLGAMGLTLKLNVSTREVETLRTALHIAKNSVLTPTNKARIQTVMQKVEDALLAN